MFNVFLGDDVEVEKAYIPSAIFGSLKPTDADEDAAEAEGDQ
jgi:hypothetical protein